MFPYLGEADGKLCAPLQLAAVVVDGGAVQDAKYNLVSIITVDARATTSTHLFQWPRQEILL